MQKMKNDIYNETYSEENITIRINHNDKMRLNEILSRQGVAKNVWLHSVIQNEYNLMSNIEQYNEYMKNVNVFVDSMTRLIMLCRASNILSMNEYKKLNYDLNKMREVVTNLSK